MEPKIIKEEAIERDSSIQDEPVINNNNNKESAFRIHTREYLKISFNKCIYSFITCLLSLITT